MVGHVPSPRGLLQIDAPARELFPRDEHVLGVRAAPERDDRLVLEQKERVAYLALDPGGEQALLQRVRLGVAHAPEPVRGQAAHRRRTVS